MTTVRVVRVHLGSGFFPWSVIVTHPDGTESVDTFATREEARRVAKLIRQRLGAR